MLKQRPPGCFLRSVFGIQSEAGKKEEAKAAKQLDALSKCRYWDGDGGGVNQTYYNELSKETEMGTTDRSRMNK